MGHYDDLREYDYTKQQANKKKKALEEALVDIRRFRSYNPAITRSWNLSLIKDGEKLFNEIERNIKAELYELRGVVCA